MNVTKRDVEARLVLLLLLVAPLLTAACSVLSAAPTCEVHQCSPTTLPGGIALSMPDAGAGAAERVSAPDAGEPSVSVVRSVRPKNPSRYSCGTRCGAPAQPSCQPEIKFDTRAWVERSPPHPDVLVLFRVASDGCEREEDTLIRIDPLKLAQAEYRVAPLLNASLYSFPTFQNLINFQDVDIPALYITNIDALSWSFTLDSNCKPKCDPESPGCAGCLSIRPVPFRTNAIVIPFDSVSPPGEKPQIQLAIQAFSARYTRLDQEPASVDLAYEALLRYARQLRKLEKEAAPEAKPSDFTALPLSSGSALFRGLFKGPGAALN